MSKTPRSKPRPTDDEALCLIHFRRSRAMAVMNEIVRGIGHAIKMPTAYQMLEYLSHMCLCLELMLKLLSGDWSSHKVGKMFETVEGSPHPHPALITALEHAIMNQKFFVAPTGGIIEHIPELEYMYDYLYGKLTRKFKGYAIHVQEQLPDNFGQFLLKNIGRFYDCRSKNLPQGTNLKESMRAYMDSRRSEVERIKQYLDAFLSAGHKMVVDNFEVKSMA